MEETCCYLKRGNEGFQMGLVRSRSFGSKRVALAANDIMEVDFYDSTPTKKLCSVQGSVFTSERSPLESLPQDILIRVLCGVKHDDLGSLLLVSKPISEAALIAKELHFAYSTPRKTVGFQDDIIADDLQEFHEYGALAPKASKTRRLRLGKKELSDVSVQLFGPDVENIQGSNLFMEIETVL